MNIESMRVRSYRSIAADEHVPEEAAERYRTLAACGNLRAAGCSEEGALEQVGISRRTRYRCQAVQVDGGSEFMAEFEDACGELRVPLHVLPPRRPQWNGCAERTNRSARIEFWSRYTRRTFGPGASSVSFIPAVEVASDCLPRKAATDLGHLPGPKGNWYFGNLRDLLPDPTPFLLQMRAQHGDCFTRAAVQSSRRGAVGRAGESNGAARPGRQFLQPLGMGSHDGFLRTQPAAP